MEICNLIEKRTYTKTATEKLYFVFQFMDRINPTVK